MPLDNLQLGLLIDAAEADWKQVEPAIFGTLLERELDKKQSHKLGAHYTPRTYFERLVTPTIMEPLREDCPRTGEDGTPVTRWDGVTTMRHPVTCEEIPDPEARVQVYDYAKPKAADWPEADFIIGNPPFIGASRMRDALCDGHAKALWKAYPKMPQSADFDDRGQGGSSYRAVVDSGDREQERGQ